MTAGSDGAAQELCARLAANSEYWDVRPVLALQREVEVLLLGDLLDFAERFPWTDDDLNSGRMSAVLLVRRLALADVTPARREKLLRVSRRDTVGLAASFRTTTHRVGKSLLRAVSRMPAVELGANKDMAMLCELVCCGGGVVFARAARSRAVGGGRAHDGARQ